MNKWKVEWTGGFPALCSGEWRIYKNGELLNIEPPFGDNPADTYGEYSNWYFNDDYMEETEYYEDGLDVYEWIEEYKGWLQTLTDNEEEWEDIYYQFQNSDWRHGSCGGCI